MGLCLSLPSGLEVTEEDKARHKMAEKQLKDVRNNVSFLHIRSILAYFFCPSGKGKNGQGS